MIVPPPITREAREWLLAYICPSDSDGRLRAIINSMPLAPADPLDAVRARFSLEENQDITATDSDYALGYNDNYVTVWRVQDGAHWLGHGPARPLQPVSPHSALIAELKIIESGLRAEGEFGVSDVIKRAADALGKLP